MNPLQLDQLQRAYDAQLDRQARRDRNGGAPLTSRKCGPCGRFKSRPSSPCDYCGTDPVTFNGDRREYDRAHGWDL